MGVPPKVFVLLAVFVIGVRWLLGVFAEVRVAVGDGWLRGAGDAPGASGVLVA
jgi:hypothetical protein